MAGKRRPQALHTAYPSQIVALRRIQGAGQPRGENRAFLSAIRPTAHCFPSSTNTPRRTPTGSTSFPQSEETYRGQARIVRVGTHASPGRLKRRLKDHFVRENHNGSIFRKNIGKALLNRDRDSYLRIWTLDTSKAPNTGNENKAKEAEVEGRVSDYMRGSFAFRIFPVTTKEERLRLEEAIIATLNQADDFRASSHWPGGSSPEWEIREGGMWLKQGLDAEPLTDAEIVRLSRLTSDVKQRAVFKAAGGYQSFSPALKAGDRIRHSAFGDGTVLLTRNLAGDTLAEVEFDVRGKSGCCSPRRKST